ncbi:MAG: hypothetical protein EXS01_02125 [Phycisphaerales bacterium]|nr:hypothetical protein [Phycisphaerales bacterium]
MRQRSRIVALTIANAILLCAIVAIPLSKRADGQERLGIRSHATYSMGGGNVPGVATGALYIVDQTHDEMLSLMWNDSVKSMTILGYRNLAADSAVSSRPRP